MSWAEHSVEIAAPIETSFDAIVDYESFPAWQNAIDSVEVLSRTGDGLGQDVKLFVDAKVRKIDYVLRYSYERPTRIEWDFVEGNGMRDMDGVYTLEPAGPERTRATYKLGADPEIPVPAMVARRVHKQLVKRSVEDLKQEAERRYADQDPVAADAGAEAEPAAAQPEARPPSFGSREQPAEAAPNKDWKPKAEREPPPPPPSSSRSGSGRGSLGELPGALVGRGLEAAGDVAKASRGAAEGALHAGKGAAGTALEIGTRIAGRVERLLGRRGGDR